MFEEDCKYRRGIIVINSKDNLCLPRALVVTITKDPLYTAIRKEKGRRQTVKAQNLMQEVRVARIVLALLNWKGFRIS